MHVLAYRTDLPFLLLSSLDVPKGAVPFSRRPLFPSLFLSNITLGRNVSSVGGPDNLSGMIDSARFYTTALSSAELEAVFFQFSAPEPSTVMLLLLGLYGLMLRRSRRQGS